MRRVDVCIVEPQLIMAATHPACRLPPALAGEVNVAMEPGKDSGTSPVCYTYQPEVNLNQTPGNRLWVIA